MHAFVFAYLVCVCGVCVFFSVCMCMEVHRRTLVTLWLLLLLVLEDGHGGKSGEEVV